MATHLTAVLEIHETTVVEEKRDRYGNLEVSASRDVSEVARIVLRADDLASLVKKIEAHSALLAD